MKVSVWEVQRNDGAEFFILHPSTKISSKVQADVAKEASKNGIPFRFNWRTNAWTTHRLRKAVVVDYRQAWLSNPEPIVIG